MCVANRSLYGGRGEDEGRPERVKATAGARRACRDLDPCQLGREGVGQLQALHQLLQTLPGVVIVGGDFNTLRAEVAGFCRVPRWPRWFDSFWGES